MDLNSSFSIQSKESLVSNDLDSSDEEFEVVKDSEEIDSLQAFKDQLSQIKLAINFSTSAQNTKHESISLMEENLGRVMELREALDGVESNWISSKIG